jgi:hypothetical protein
MLGKAEVRINTKSLPERFNAKWCAEPVSGCWRWSGGIQTRGYGMICIDGKMELAHRVAWRLFRGELPIGLCVLHKCDVRSCVNPEHLFLGTVQDNQSDAVQKGRIRNGEAHYNAKLTQSQVLEIRASTESSPKIAQRFGISPRAVRHLRKRETWKHE